MIVWRVTRSDDEEGTVLDWFATKRQAVEHAEECDRETGGCARVDQILIPESKAALVEWLNANVMHDNG